MGSASGLLTERAGMVLQYMPSAHMDTHKQSQKASCLLVFFFFPTIFCFSVSLFLLRGVSFRVYLLHFE